MALEIKMKILLIQKSTYVPAHGGANKSNRCLMEELANKGHTCRVIAAASDRQTPETQTQFLSELALREINVAHLEPDVFVFNHQGVEVHAIANTAKFRPYIVDQINTFDPTWVLVSSEDPGQVLLDSALEASPLRVIYLAHTILHFPFGPLSYIKSSAKTRLIRQAALVITVSHYLKNYIYQWSGIDSVVFPFPVFGSGPFSKISCFDKGFVSIINPCAYKGISIFLELARQLPNIEFAAVPVWGTTQADRIALEQLPNVHILQPSDNIDDIFVQTRILLVPSLWAEGLPSISIEAMLRGIPVLASDSGGLPEAKLGVDYILPVRSIEHYEENFDDRGNPIPLVPDQDIKPWLKTLNQVTSNRIHYEQLSQASYVAALKFIETVAISPIENYLRNLSPAVRNENDNKPTHNSGFKDGKLDEVLQNLSPEKRALFAYRIKRHTRASQGEET